MRRCPKWARIAFEGSPADGSQIKIYLVDDDDDDDDDGDDDDDDDDGDDDDDDDDDDGHHDDDVEDDHHPHPHHHATIPIITIIIIIITMTHNDSPFIIRHSSITFDHLCEHVYISHRPWRGAPAMLAFLSARGDLM